MKGNKYTSPALEEIKIKVEEFICFSCLAGGRFFPADT